MWEFLHLISTGAKGDAREMPSGGLHAHQGTRLGRFKRMTMYARQDGFMETL